MSKSLAGRGESHMGVGTMMRVRLKADGRIVEILPDGSERQLSPPMGDSRAAGNGDAAYARGVRAGTKLTQAEFAARIGVPIETVRNWEQGKRSPRGPARALLKLIEKAPDVAFSVLSAARTAR
jgi:putative transcriptional regulator